MKRRGQLTCGKLTCGKLTADFGKLTRRIGVARKNPRRTINGRRITAARQAIEERIGRELPGWITVRHKDRDPENNDLGNLYLWVGAIHGGMPAKEVLCPHCGGNMSAPFQPKKKGRGAQPSIEGATDLEE